MSSFIKEAAAPSLSEFQVGAQGPSLESDNDLGKKNNNTHTQLKPLVCVTMNEKRSSGGVGPC